MKVLHNRIWREFRGSYTIEISLLMGIILPVLVGIMYLSFYLHDCAFTQAAAQEAASWASLHPDESGLQQVMEKLIQGRMLGSENVTVSAGKTETDVNVACAGSFQMPGLLANLFEKSKVGVTSQVHLKTEPPSRKIQKIRGMIKIANTVRGKDR